MFYSFSFFFLSSHKPSNLIKIKSSIAIQASFHNKLQMVHVGQRSQMLASLLAISQPLGMPFSKRQCSRYHLRPNESESLGMEHRSLYIFCSACGEWGEAGINYWIFCTQKTMTKTPLGILLFDTSGTLLSIPLYPTCDVWRKVRKIMILSQSWRHTLATNFLQVSQSSWPKVFW